jgi:opacity protein-like surface antigen
MRITLFVGAAVAAFAVATAASAQVGPYAAVDFGVNFPQDFNLKSRPMSSGVPLDWKFHIQDGLMADGRLGYYFTPHVRGEVEFAYRDGPINSVGGNQFPPPSGLLSPTGHVNNWSLMANLIYDFMPDAKWTPFLGVGAGEQQVNARVSGVLDAVPAGYAPWRAPDRQGLQQRLRLAVAGRPGVQDERPDEDRHHLPLSPGRQVEPGRPDDRRGPRPAARHHVRQPAQPFGDDRPALRLRRAAGSPAAPAAPAAAASPAAASPAASAASAPAASAAGG